MLIIIVVLMVIFIAVSFIAKYVFNQKVEKEIHQGTLLRYLAETMWFPTAALNDYLTWEEMDQYNGIFYIPCLVVEVYELGNI